MLMFIISEGIDNNVNILIFVFVFQLENDFGVPSKFALLYTKPELCEMTSIIPSNCLNTEEQTTW